MRNLEVVVLGSAAAYPGKGQACSGYLVRQDDTALLLDCGTGVLSNLFAWTDPFELSAIVISHLHPDHFLDLYPLRYYLTYNERNEKRPIALYLPEGGEALLSRLVSDETSFWAPAFDVRTIRPESALVGELELGFFPVSHGEMITFGVDVRGDKKIVYTSDCQYEPSLVDRASAADLFIAEATLKEDQTPSELAHLTAGQAGEIAAKAGVRKLLLTHFWPAFDRESSRQEAARVFDGQLAVASENQVHSLV